MAGHILSKSTFIRARQCVKSLYLNKFHGNLRDRISPEQLAKFRRGTDIGKLARELFPGGVDMSPKSPTQYQKKVEETALAILNPDISVIYEAVVQFNGVLIMLDILKRTEAGWIAYEVKSSLSISETYLTDAALQYYVLHGAAIDIRDFHLVYMNRDYTFTGELALNELFTSISVFEQVKSRCVEIENDVTLFKQTLLSGNVPEVPIGLQCNYPYPCDFKGFCWKNVPKTSILNLNAFPSEQLFDWFNHGICQPVQIPAEAIEAQLQQEQIRSLVLNKPYFDTETLKNNFYPLRNVKTAFVKALLHRPALPTIIDSKPYQPQLLSLVITGDGETIETHFFRQNGNQVDVNIMEKISLLVESYQKIVMYDATDFRQFLLYQNDTNLSEKIIDIKDILRDSTFYHPHVDRYMDFENVAKSLLQKPFYMKNETYLIADILAEPAGNNSIHNALKQYILIMHQLFKLLNFEVI